MRNRWNSTRLFESVLIYYFPAGRLNLLKTRRQNSFEHYLQLRSSLARFDVPSVCALRARFSRVCTNTFRKKIKEREIQFAVQSEQFITVPAGKRLHIHQFIDKQTKVWGKLCHGWVMISFWYDTIQQVNTPNAILWMLFCHGGWGCFFFPHQFPVFQRIGESKSDRSFVIRSGFVCFFVCRLFSSFKFVSPSFCFRSLPK